MNIKTIRSSTASPENKRVMQPSLLDRLAKRLLCQRLSQLRQGCLTLCEGSSTQTFGQRTERCDLNVTIHIHHPGFYSDVTFGGSIGAGEAYMQGYWDTPHLTDLMRILLINRDVLDGMDTGWSQCTIFMQKILHWAARNTHQGSKKNIAAHYDLGNDFFELFLDSTLMYSSAVFERSDMTLEMASLAKLERLCRKLNVQPHDHVLEIGTGWGGFAIYAATHYGCQVTTTTISQQQYDKACERIRAAGLEHKITILLKDYRDLVGQYDKLVSIEMIEAVGHHYYDTYFRACSALLKPEGIMVLQAITIADQRYEAAKKSVDFIQRYIFPGSCIPSIQVMSSAIARVTDMRMDHLEDIGLHYATTLRIWRENFFSNLQSIRALGYSEVFIRMWEFYFCYCEAGFIERAVSDVQIVLMKPHASNAPIKTQS